MMCIAAHVASTAQESHALVADIDRRMLIDRTQWTLQQNRNVISALKRENKELKDSLKTQPLPEKQQVRGLGRLVMQRHRCLPSQPAQPL